jgi:hypothetical protein
MVTILAPFRPYISIIDIEFIYRRKQATIGFLKGTKGRISDKFIKETTLKDGNLRNNVIM